MAYRKTWLDGSNPWMHVLFLAALLTVIVCAMLIYTRGSS
jgi:hypothetical protein